MKKAVLFFLYFSIIINSQAQHQLSAYGGVTFSKIQKTTNPSATTNAMDNDLYAFPILPAGYLALEYEYDWKFLRLSTGLSFLTFGTSEFLFRDAAWETWYIAVPVIGGVKWNLTKDFDLTIETGLEIGYEIGTGVWVLSYGDDPWGTLNGIVGIEAKYKRLKWGVRLQYGLTKFRVLGANGETTLRHSALTAYIGYTLWNSKKVRDRRAN